MVDSPVLVCTQGPLEGERFPIGDDGLTLGRAEDNDVVIEDDDVSRAHARLQYVNGSLWLRDLGSRNGVFVNDVRVSGHQDLRVGDEVRLGAAVFKVRWASELAKADEPTAEEKPKKSWYKIF